MPTYIAYRVAELEGSSSNNCTAGAAYNLLSRCVIAVSLVTLAAVSLDRYIALRVHLSYKETITIKRTVIFLVSVWVVCASVSALWLIHSSLTHLLAVLLVIVCVLLSSFSYFKTY